MGSACSTCLPFLSSPRTSKSDEHAPLNPTSQPAYDSFYPPSPSASHAHPQTILHEREFFDRLVAQTSENLIDIFAPPMLGGSGGRGEWYRVVVERMSVPEEEGDRGEVQAREGRLTEEERGWLKGVVEGAEEAVGRAVGVKGVGRLVVGLE